MSPQPTAVVIGLGNPLLSDDAVGLQAVERARPRLATRLPEVDCKLNLSGGMDLLDDLVGYPRALLVDAIQTGQCPPGTCLEFDLAALGDVHQDRLVAAHGLTLPAVLETGRRCGYAVPATTAILGVEVADVHTFSEQLTPAVAAGLDRVVDRIEATLLQWRGAKDA